MFLCSVSKSYILDLWILIRQFLWTLPLHTPNYLSYYVYIPYISKLQHYTNIVIP